MDIRKPHYNADPQQTQNPIIPIIPKRDRNRQFGFKRAPKTINE